MQFETKIAIVVRQDLATWQKMNVAAFLATSLIAENPELAGESYRDQDGTVYGRMIVQPMLMYGSDLARLRRVLERSLARQVIPAIYVEEMFATMNDEANRAAVRAQSRADLTLVGVALRAERKIVDKVLEGLKFHE
jgi:hypothetical protein